MPVASRVVLASAAAGVIVAALPLAVPQPARAQAVAQPSAEAQFPGGASDPFEGVNRGLYSLHRGIDKVLIRPVAKAYLTITPRPMQQGIHNAVINLQHPVTIANQVLQARFTYAGESLTRFVTNSTVGLAGLVDVAGKNGLPYRPADFGQTLARYGVGAGPYIFIPVLGPSTLRDATGRVVDSVGDPVRMVQFDGDTELAYGRIGFGALDVRATYDRELEALETTATDPYVTLRSVYLQNRQTFVSGGQVDVESLPSFGPDLPNRPRSDALDVTEPRTQVSETFSRSVR